MFHKKIIRMYLFFQDEISTIYTFQEKCKEKNLGINSEFSGQSICSKFYGKIVFLVLFIKIQYNLIKKYMLLFCLQTYKSQ